MQELIHQLLPYGQLSTEQVEYISSRIVPRRLRAGDYFSVAGRSAGEIAFIMKGIMRIGYYVDEGHDATQYFIDEKNFVVDLDDAHHQEPLTEFVQAVIKTELAVLTASALQSLPAVIPDWQKMVNQL